MRHEEDGFHVYPDSGSISWGISQVLCDFDRAKRMGLAGRERCETDFSWDHIAWQTENVYYAVKG